MAKMQVKGLDEYAIKVRKLSRNSQAIIKKAVYNGAAVVANTVKKGLQDIPVENGYGTKEKPLRGISRKQKSDLIRSMGLAPIQNFKNKGYINTKLGWDGYGSIPTKTYPKGVPNQLLMRSVESGTSFRKKTPVVRRAVNRAKPLSIKKMSETVDEELRKEFG